MKIIYPVERKEQLHKREGEVIRQYDTFKNGYNGCVAGRTCKDYYNENKDKLLEMNKQHYINNREEIIKKNNDYQN